MIKIITKLLSHQYRKSYRKDKTIIWRSYLHDGAHIPAIRHPQTESGCRWSQIRSWTTWLWVSSLLNTLRLRQNGCHSQTIYSNVFSCMKMFEFRLGFCWSLFPRFQLTINQHICVTRPQWVNLDMGQVTKVGPSCHLALLSIDSKTQPRLSCGGHWVNEICLVCNINCVIPT